MIFSDYEDYIDFKKKTGMEGDDALIFLLDKMEKLNEVKKMKNKLLNPR